MMAVMTPSTRTELMQRAYDRAIAEGIVVFRTANPRILGVASVRGGWSLKPYEITIHGEGVTHVTCSCKAGQTRTMCKHLASAFHARKYGVYAKQRG